MNDAPRDNLIRARYNREAATLREDGGAEGRTLFGHFAVFDTWTTIDSAYEGTFLERVAPGAFAGAIEDRAAVRVLYDHGQDPSIGNKPLANPTDIHEDERGVYYEAELFDADYVNALLPAIRAGQLGASFRFSVLGEDWDQPTRSSSHNPERLAERTITDVKLYEFGPVTFPAYADASAGLRSGTDSFMDHLLRDPTFVARFTERAGLKVVEQVLAAADGHATATPADATDGPSRTHTPTQPPPLTRERRHKQLALVNSMVAAAHAKDHT